MSDSHDISIPLEAWAWDPAGLNARQIQLNDGRQVIQVRLELGLLQMEMTGRPDGTRPQGQETWLDVAIKGGDSSLTEDALQASIRAEILQLFQRVAAARALGIAQLVLHDADGILKRMDWCHGEGDDAARIESLRPQALLLRARAGAELAMAAGRPDAARKALASGLEDLSQCLPHDQFDARPEVAALREMHALLVPRLPASQRVELQTRLAEALASENYELAAILRNEIRQLLD
ncbi:MAG: UvrB/UvrC motif-containing protein [Phycisphaerales bacterium]|nr:UvrB/UvrC motif-containing protein [Phycisphaerales bacterium]